MISSRLPCTPVSHASVNCAAVILASVHLVLSSRTCSSCSVIWEHVACASVTRAAVIRPCILTLLPPGLPAHRVGGELEARY